MLLILVVSVNSSSGLLADFQDGRVLFSHTLFSLHPNILQLFLYYDDVELCNPLGSKRHKHKLDVCLELSFLILYFCL